MILTLATIGRFRLQLRWMALAWAGHIGWDFVPRTLPAMLADLPESCAIFDGVIALHPTWMRWTQRWSTEPLVPESPKSGGSLSATAAQAPTLDS